MSRAKGTRSPKGYYAAIDGIENERIYRGQGGDEEEEEEKKTKIETYGFTKLKISAAVQI